MRGAFLKFGTLVRRGEPDMTAQSRTRTAPFLFFILFMNLSIFVPQAQSHRGHSRQVSTMPTHSWPTITAPVHRPHCNIPFQLILLTSQNHHQLPPLLRVTSVMLPLHQHLNHHITLPMARPTSLINPHISPLYKATPTLCPTS